MTVNQNSAHENIDIITNQTDCLQNKVRVTLEEIVHKYTLNEKQKMVLYLYCSQISTSEQKIIFMGGKGGTGKSRVLEAIEDHFKRNGSEFELQISATTGSAANVINGILFF